MKKILVIQQKMIGDVLASTVICEAIKRELPHCTVHYMVHPNTKPVLNHNPFIDRVVVFDPKKIKGFAALRDFGRQLKDENYDAVIDAYGKWESIIPAYFSGAKQRIGHFKWYTSLFYTKTVKPAKNVMGSAIVHRLQLAEAFTGKNTQINFPKIYLSDGEIANARSVVSLHLNRELPVVMVSVLGSSLDKSLPALQMAELLDTIAETSSVQLLFNYMPDQHEDAMAIYNQCNAKTQKIIVLDLPLKGLRDFIAVLSQCDALIGNEGGAVNMAKALGIPTFTVFSPFVNKESWNMLADDQNHVAVHLRDYFPEIYGGKHSKHFRKQAAELYKKMAPALFRSQLISFIKRITS